MQNNRQIRQQLIEFIRTSDSFYYSGADFRSYTDVQLQTIVDRIKEKEEEAETTIRVLIVDDNGIHRKVTRMYLDEYGDIDIIGECTDGKEVCDFLSNENIDVVLMDIKMEYLDGIDATRLVRENHPDVKVIAHSSHTDDFHKAAMFSAGAVGYIVKGTDIKHVRETIKAAADGQVQLQ